MPIELLRETQRKVELSQIAAFNAYKEKGIRGIHESSQWNIAAVLSSYVDIDSEANLNMKWNNAWMVIVPLTNFEMQGSPPAVTSSQEAMKCEVNGYHIVNKFCIENNLEQTLENYTSIACRIFRGAEITLSLSSDPEIENNDKIKLNIKMDIDFDGLISLDEKFHKAIDVLVSEQDRDFFVKTYELPD